MDTHSIELPLPEAEALRRVVDRVLGGMDAVVAGTGGMAALLDAAAHALCVRQHRPVLCVLDSWDTSRMGVPHKSWLSDRKQVQQLLSGCT